MAPVYIRRRQTDLHPVSWTVLSWKIPVMMGGPGYGVCDEEIEVLISAES